MRSKKYVVTDGTITQPLIITGYSIKDCLGEHYFPETSIRFNQIFMFKSVDKHPRRNKIARNKLMDIAKQFKHTMECKNSHIVNSTVKLHEQEYNIIALITHDVYSSEGCCDRLPELVKEFIVEG